jgi:hypothetical protein
LLQLEQLKKQIQSQGNTIKKLEKENQGNKIKG